MKAKIVGNEFGIASGPMFDGGAYATMNFMIKIFVDVRQRTRNYWL